MTEILIRVKARVYDCYDHCSSDCDLTHEEVSFETLLEENKGRQQLSLNLRKSRFMWVKILK
jgi:hypothetical protein